MERPGRPAFETHEHKQTDNRLSRTRPRRCRLELRLQDQAVHDCFTRNTGAMNFLSRLFARTNTRRPYASVDGKTLLDQAQNHFANTIRLYEPADSSNSLWKKTEYGCFLYFRVHSWHEKQIPAIRDYRGLLDILAYKLEEAAPALMLTRMNFVKNISPEEVISDRLRIYGNIIKTEPKGTTSGLPVFSACLWLGALSAHNRELQLNPEVTSSGQLFSLCLKEHIMPDALEHYAFFKHSMDVLTKELVEITEMLTELNARRLANDSL